MDDNSKDAVTTLCVRPVPGYNLIMALAKLPHDNAGVLVSTHTCRVKALSVFWA